MSENEKNVPKRRFKEFENAEAWEQRKLGELTDVYDGTHQTPNYKENGIMFLSVENIKTLQSEKYISEEDFEKDFKIYPQKDDVLMTRIGDIGTTNVVESNAPKAYYVSLALLKHKELNPYFLKESIASEAVKKDIWQRTLHIAFPKKINKNEIANVGILYPKSKKEQEEIGIFFRNLNNLITLHQRKLEKMKALKKAYLTDMFPAEGERSPKLRFAGFTDDWEQRRLKDVATFINGRAYSQDELLNTGKYEVLRVGNFYTNDSWYYSDLELADKYYANEGDLLYTWSATFGPHIWHGGKVIYHYHIWKIELSEELEKNFIFHLLEYDKAKITSDKNGSTMVHITKEGMENKLIVIPNVDEQKKISAFLDHFDNLITIHHYKLEKLQNIKKAYLNEMFI